METVITLSKAISIAHEATYLMEYGNSGSDERYAIQVSMEQESIDNALLPEDPKEANGDMRKNTLCLVLNDEGTYKLAYEKNVRWMKNAVTYWILPDRKGLRD